MVVVATDPFGENIAATTRMSGERLATMMPLRRTSSGRVGCATCTRLFNCTTARSRSVPISNVQVMVSEPSCDALET